jgi:hypothetical protein
MGLHELKLDRCDRFLQAKPQVNCRNGRIAIMVTLRGNYIIIASIPLSGHGNKNEMRPTENGASEGSNLKPKNGS